MRLPLLLLALALLPAAHAEFCREGDSMNVEWKGQWYPAKVLKASPDGERCYIQYQGYGSEWNEWVTEDRAEVTAHADGGGVQHYMPGDTVSVRWKGTWYPASVLEARHGRYRIHYDGYNASWDEWVGPSRVRPR